MINELLSHFTLKSLDHYTALQFRLSLERIIPKIPKLSGSFTMTHVENRTLSHL